MRGRKVKAAYRMGRIHLIQGDKGATEKIDIDRTCRQCRWLGGEDIRLTEDIGQTSLFEVSVYEDL